ncbi:uncharacterized protein LOC118486501 [Helianthus annuus]|uniref:uncharacterized protein LOC118486501 n=1 Tax=Helianthus annuus TaxID=4232 RepID=UPI001652FAE7|nr:uncharacterized protein LOC118486501 [Helianthus annuus]
MDSTSNDEVGSLSHSMDEVNSVQISVPSVNFDHDQPFCVNGFEQQDSISSHVYEFQVVQGIGSQPFLLKLCSIQELGFVQEAIIMYENYAEHAGFSTRLGTTLTNKQGVITIKYILCSKANKPKDQEVDSGSSNSLSRRTNFNVTDYKSLIQVKLVKNSTDYKVYEFVDVHNHGPISKQFRFEQEKKEIGCCNKRVYFQLSFA